MNRLPTPSELMRSKRPYLYSDSECTDAYRLSETELSHHLETLTARNQHKDFEVFCRKLSERELCPNLRPQTGPEGGGDGKVDTETYPVDEQISERWYVGDGKSGAERWGFAFSTKKVWSEKVRSDVKGIVDTERDYGRIIFITSRPTRQRDRLRIQDELKEQYGISVTILDREWIIDRVFSHSHKDLVHEHLKAGEYQPDRIKLGPRDFKRQQTLDELEARLVKQGSTVQEQTQAVTDTFEAARLSRELEKPRFETEGRFSRAITYAKKYGMTYQHLRAVYEYAWTAFWWFDDVEIMNQQYEEVEKIAFASEHAVHIAKVCNLHQILAGRVSKGYETSEELFFVERTKRLKDKLEDLAADGSRPSNALHAETLLVFRRMSENTLLGEQRDFDSIWLDLIDIIHRAAGLAEYPADLIEAMVNAIAEFMPDSEAFDRLVETLAEFMADRSKEVKAGTFYLQQGERKLNAEKPIDGIKWLGRAVLYLSKDESREDQAKALYYLTVGYRGAGLYWAARAAVLAAIIQYLALSEIEGKLRVETIPALNLFALVSLQLGHVFDFLSAVRFLQAIGRSAPLDEDSEAMLNTKLTELDRLLSCLFIVQPSEQVRRLQGLPDVLEGLMLFSARLTLLYRLGHIDALRADGSIPKEEKDEDFYEMMTLLASQPACRSLPKSVVLFDDMFSGVQTKILGVDIEIETSSILEGVLQAETYAAAIEGFSATLLNTDVLPHTEKLKVRIRQLDDIQDASITVDDNRVMEVSVPTNWQLTDFSNIGNYNEHIISYCIHALVSVAVIGNPEKTIEELVQVENGLERATMFCRAGIARNRVFGTHAGSISDWSDFVGQPFPMTSNAPDSPAINELPPRAAGDEEERPQGFDEIRRHDDIVVQAIINPRLWDAAEWKGMMYGVSALGEPPVLGLMFANSSKGEAIFGEWIERFGKEDTHDALHISVIKGIDRQNPFHYRGHITQNLFALTGLSGKTLVNTSRMNTMTVENHANLDRFCEHLEASGAYYLVPVALDGVGTPNLLMEQAILKRQFNVREAWEIGPHDIDAVAVRSDDDVVVPVGEGTPPFFELVRQREGKQKKSPSDK
ncbi:hypothetical protein JET14_09585 [Martelella lutilitoris]|uniref:Uncharacterized protein n=1 Tax=Martelella lutilitoris TaxID=2583532 RepID=A0A7T7KNA3_9HYPH|nr:hypothetical protein [Martelella lutilitoris]QQM32358.1 hypothetical protein JET14_09585 [Martelella lutilitoris]